jgi:hypothetical protein
VPLVLGWFGVTKLADLALGGKHGAWFVTCRMCMV